MAADLPVPATDDIDTQSSYLPDRLWYSTNIRRRGVHQRRKILNDICRYGND